MRGAVTPPKNSLTPKQLFMIESMQGRLSFLTCVTERGLVVKYFYKLPGEEEKTQLKGQAAGTSLNRPGPDRLHRLWQTAFLPALGPRSVGFSLCHWHFCCPFYLYILLSFFPSTLQPEGQESSCLHCRNQLLAKWMGFCLESLAVFPVTPG